MMCLIWVSFCKKARSIIYLLRHFIYKYAFRLKGPDRVKFIEGLTVADVAEMPKNEIKLSVFTNEKGGIKVSRTLY